MAGVRPDGKRKQRRMVVGSIRQFADESAALRTITALRRDINLGNARLRAKPITVSELVDRYRQRELEPDTAWKTHSTKVTYQGYLNKWILPRWGAYPLSRIQAGEVELWLRSLPLARATCAKARNLLCILSFTVCDMKSTIAIPSAWCGRVRNEGRFPWC